MAPERLQALCCQLRAPQREVLKSQLLGAGFIRVTALKSPRSSVLVNDPHPLRN